MISITSAELNYLVFRYLYESGFTHSAFVVGSETGISKTNIDGNLVPPGALVTFIHKGIQFLELEANLTNDDLDSDEDFQFLSPLDLITKDVSELQRIVIEKKASIKDKAKGKDEETIENGEEPDRGVAMSEDGKLTNKNERENQQLIEKEKECDRDRLDREKERDMEITEEDREKAEGKQTVDDIHDADHTRDMKVNNGGLEENGTEGGAVPMDICTNLASESLEIPSKDITVLEGHRSEVLSCAWNPSCPLLASCSGDSTARIWTIGRPSTSNLQNGPASFVLDHFRTNEEKNTGVTTLEWNVDGMLLATGSYDGQARIWRRDGELISTLNKHRGPILTSKWNKKGDYLLSGGVDGKAIVWDVNKRECKQEFEFHKDAVLDVDWKNNNTFASCSSDGMVYVCKIGENRPIRSYSGHHGEVNTVKWDPTGSILATGSDDSTAKLWSMKQETHLLDLRAHTELIHMVRWSPTGPGTNNPNKQLVLASASFDSTIKLWDFESGHVLQSLHGHREPVYSISFSPNGKYLASGSPDECLNIWSLKDGKIIRTFTGNGRIFEVCWNKAGNRIAACSSDNLVRIFDIRM